MQLSIVAIATMFGLTACSGGAEVEEATTDNELTPVEVGVIPISDVAPIYLGQQEGIFEDYGLDVTLTQERGGDTIIPAVESRELDFGYSNVTSLVIAHAEGTPVEIVATGAQTTGSSDNDFSAVMVDPASKIEAITDLEGKTVAVNTLNNIFDSMISEGLEQTGGDPNQVEFVELAFPDMVDQLEAGNVDAIATVEPFAVVGDQAGLERIYGPFSQSVADLSVGGYFATEQTIADNPELISQFSAAMQASQAFSENHPGLVRDAIASYTTTDTDILEKTTLPHFPQQHNRASLQQIIDISQRLGLIDHPVDVEDLIIDDA